MVVDVIVIDFPRPLQSPVQRFISLGFSRRLTFSFLIQVQNVPPVAAAVLAGAPAELAIAVRLTRPLSSLCLLGTHFKRLLTGLSEESDIEFMD